MLRYVVVLHTCKKTQVVCRVRLLGQDTYIFRDKEYMLGGPLKKDKQEKEVWS